MIGNGIKLRFQSLESATKACGQASRLCTYWDKRTIRKQRHEGSTMTTNSTGGRKFPLTQIIFAVAAALVVAGLWMQRNLSSKLIETNTLLQQQNAALQKELEGLRSTPAAATPVTPVAPGPEAAIPPAVPATPAIAAPPATPPNPADNKILMLGGMATPPRSDGMKLAGVHAIPTDGGIRATMTFNSTTADPIGVVAVVIRLPHDAEGRILKFEPSSGAAFSDIIGRITEDGKFAVFQGKLGKAESVEFALTVSGPAVADVRGTSGVGPLKLRVTPTGASVE